MENPPKEWKVEYAKTSRSSCKVCKKIIEKEKLRLGKMVRATQFDGFMPRWNHPHCILKTPNRIKFLDDIEGIDMLRWEDQQKIRKYIESGVLFFNTATVAVNECSIEFSKTKRAKCKLCNKKILEGEVRISTKPNGPDSKILAWHHAKCYMQSSPSTQLEKLSGWDNFSLSDQEAVNTLATVGVSTSKSASKFGSQEDEELLQKPFKGGTKRKLGATSDKKSEGHKAEGNVSVKKVRNEDNASDLRNQNQNSLDLESKIEDQNKALWAIKDELKIHATIAEMREMLEANSQHSAGLEMDLRDRCADGMLFGALGSCPLCSGSLRYSGVEYRCHGYLSAWSKCFYSTSKPIRLKEKWRIPKKTNNNYLCKWFKSQKGQKPVRILPSLFNIATGSLTALKDLKVTIDGFSEECKEKWKSKIEGAGGTIHAQIKKDTKCLVVSGKLDFRNIEVRRASIMRLPILRVDYLVDCIEKQKVLPFDFYKIRDFDEAITNMVTVKVKGKSSVHESSGLQYSGHILEDGKSIYNTTLSMSDLSIGVNSYYVLQVIQEDKRPDCYVFREWGRVGNSEIGGNKLEKMSKSHAVLEFKRLFLKKTGNTWEAWEQKETFQKHPGRFFPLDIDYGVNKQIVKKKATHNAKCRLAPSLVKLIKMLFNIETYRSAMMEFEIDMSEMPLGKLSKSNIQKGFEALTEIQNLLNGNNQDPSVRKSLLVDASNRFFTVIPSVHPHVIGDENDFRSKVKMLEALQDIEIASRLVGFDVDNDESLDEKYTKLHCAISPLPHDSKDYQLVEKYLLTTHASTHKDWTLELEDVFTLEREGEFDKFAPYRDILQNKMLLWHGSRLTNFVGILSQGLRIAPREAPSTGYMFGKGIYFADLVSKSAQYCYTNTSNPVGLMLLSEVALGDVYELKQASYMEKPPEGKHSTKGLGKKIPQKSEYVTWKNEVVVPCGKPVSSNARSSELMYNEYIVYDTAQVKMQFLLKVRFHHKK